MNILSLIHRYHPAVGGAETYLKTIHQRLVERGHTVTVLTSDAADFELFWTPGAKRFDRSTDEHDGVSIHRFPVQHMPFSNISYPAVRLLTGRLAAITPNGAWVKKMVQLTPRIPAMAEWLATTKTKFDLVMGTTITLESLLAMGQQFAQAQNIPFVAVPLTHLGAGHSAGSAAISRFYTLPQQQNMVQQASGVIAINPAEAEFYASQGTPADNITIAPPAPDFAALSGGDGERWRKKIGVSKATPVVATISALTQAKGSTATLAAMQQLWRSGHTIKLAMAGNRMGDFDQAVSKLSQTEREHLILLGKVSDADRNDLLAAADVFCMPSLVESFGIAFIEAMLYKKPVIGAPVWGVKDFVIEQGKNGFLVHPDQTAELAHQILKLIEDQPQAQQMGEAGYAFATQLSWDASVSKIENLLVRLTRSRKKTRGQA